MSDEFFLKNRSSGKALRERVDTALAQKIQKEEEKKRAAKIRKKGKLPKERTGIEKAEQEIRKVTEKERQITGRIRDELANRQRKMKMEHMRKSLEKEETRREEKDRKQKASKNFVMIDVKSKVRGTMEKEKALASETGSKIIAKEKDIISSVKQGVQKGLEKERLLAGGIRSKIQGRKEIKMAEKARKAEEKKAREAEREKKLREVIRKKRVEAVLYGRKKMEEEPAAENKKKIAETEEEEQEETEKTGIKSKIKLEKTRSEFWERRLEKRTLKRREVELIQKKKMDERKERMEVKDQLKIKKIREKIIKKSEEGLEEIAKPAETPAAQQQAEVKKEEVRYEPPSVMKEGIKRMKRMKNVEDGGDLPNDAYYRTQIPGFDELFQHGIPIGSSVLVAGGPGTGKTIFCLQTAINACKQGHKCLYMSFEEPEENLRQHMKDFGWEPVEYENKGLLRIKRFNTIDLARSIEALLSEAKKELLIEIDPVLFPKDFKPDFVFIDSLSAIAAAFTGEVSRYRIYMEQLFRFLEKSEISSFLITEISDQRHQKITESGVEEFLADGIIVFYKTIDKKTGIRQNGIEILKMRSEGFQGKIVKMEVKDKEGIVVHPNEKIVLS